jgi:hypothetical protein
MPQCVLHFCPTPALPTAQTENQARPNPPSLGSQEPKILPLKSMPQFVLHFCPTPALPAAQAENQARPSPPSLASQRSRILPLKSMAQFVLHFCPTPALPTAQAENQAQPTPPSLANQRPKILPLKSMPQFVLHFCPTPALPAAQTKNKRRRANTLQRTGVAETVFGGRRRADYPSNNASCPRRWTTGFSPLGAISIANLKNALGKTTPKNLLLPQTPPG